MLLNVTTTGAASFPLRLPFAGSGARSLGGGHPITTVAAFPLTLSTVRASYNTISVFSYMYDACVFYTHMNT